MPTKQGPVRRSITLPAAVAKRVHAIAKDRRTSASRVVVDLVVAGLAARDMEKARFLDLADRLARSKDPAEQARIKRELSRMTFGE